MFGCYNHLTLFDNLVRVFHLDKVLRMISVELTETECISLSVAARAMVLAYERQGIIKEEAYLELVKAAEKLEQAMWGPVTPV